jgi:hypothetical protein
MAARGIAARTAAFVGNVAIGFIAIEILVLLIALVGGEIEQVFSPAVQGALLAVVAAAVFLLDNPGPVRTTAAPRESGCRICGASQAPEYATEYGWYQTVASETGAIRETRRTYLPLGVSRVFLCDSCAIHESRRRQAAAARFAWKAVIVGVSALVLVAWLTGALAPVGLAGPRLSPDAAVFTWMAGVGGSVLLLHPLAMALEALYRHFAGDDARRDSLRAFAQAWSWDLAKDEIVTRHENQDPVEAEVAGIAIITAAGIGPRIPDVDSWERRTRAIGSLQKYRKRI